MSDKPIQFCSVPIDLAIKHAKKMPFDIYIKLNEDNDKMVKLGKKEFDYTDTFQKYKSKGVVEIYVDKDDYLLFLKEVKKGLSGQFFEESAAEDKLVYLDKTFDLVKKSFRNFGVSEHLLDMSKEIATKSIQAIKTQPSLNTFFTKFKNKCGQEFIKNILVGYASSCILDTLPWSSASIKEKSNMAAMLRDILLDPEDIDELEKNYDRPETLSEKIKAHPKKTVELLSDNKFKAIPQEVLVIIEQHHERPDGKGFPAGLGHARITPLSAIHIVSDHFVRLLIEHKFDGKKRKEILAFLFDVYYQGNYRKAVEPLRQIFS